jgi:tetratricopeptide (TPR) repeat protein
VRQATALLEKLCAMQSPPEEASRNYAEILASVGKHVAAEEHFKAYLEVAKNSVAVHEENRKTESEKPGDTSRKRFVIQQYDEKIASANKKRAAVLVRLGNIHFDDGTKQRLIEADTGKTASLRTDARKNAKKHFVSALSYLHEARVLEPESLHLLVKMAQCKGELGQFEFAIRNLEQYIRICAERRLQANENIHRAYRMKSDFERKLTERRDGK